MELIIGKTYQDETIVLDGKQFEDCTFNRCLLKYGAEGSGKLIRCKVTNTTYTFTGAAERTLQKLAAMYHSGESSLVEDLFTQIRATHATL